MLSIYRKKIILFLFLIFIGLQKLSAQTKLKFQPDYDAKKVHFGYFLGLSNTNYNVKFNQSYLASLNSSKVFAITSPTSTAIKAGAVINVHINDYFDFRFSPLSISIYARKLLENDSIAHDQVDKAWFEIPAIIKYKSERRNNSRMFIFAGLKYGFETNVVNKKNGIAAVNNFATKTSDLTLEYGFGLELFREYFKVTPELHFSHGMKNLINQGENRGTFLAYVERLNTHSVTFLLVFQ